MVTAKLTSNGMINLPAKLQKKLNLKPGDEISFILTDEGILLIPKKSILTATNPNNYKMAVQAVKEIRQERNKENW